MRLALASLMIAALALAGCAEAEADEMNLTSSAFTDGGAIPAEHTCDGADTSPPLAWTDVPDGVEAFALVVTDPDAGGFVHWVLADIPGEVRELPAGEGDAIGVPGANGFGDAGWGGPCPPSGQHRYEFRLYALPGRIGLDEPTVIDVRAAAALSTGELLGLYARR